MTLEPFTAESAKELRALLVARVEACDPDGTAALALSGGMSSTALLFAMLESGRRPACHVAFPWETFPPDRQAAGELCRHFGLTLHGAHLPKGLGEVAKKVRQIAQKQQDTAVPVVRTLHVFDAIAAAMRENGHGLLLTGLLGDKPFCTNRKTEELLRYDGEEAVIAAGLRGEPTDRERAPAVAVSRWYARHGLAAAHPCDDAGWRAFLARFPLGDLQSPFGKAALARAFPDHFGQGPFRRDHCPLHVGTGVRELHDAMLADPAINPGGFRSTLSLYNRMRDGLL